MPHQRVRTIHMGDRKKARPHLLRETQLARYLATALQEEYAQLRRVERNINPQSAAFRRRWQEAFSVQAPLPQPEVDLLLVRRNEWAGIELKYLKYRASGKGKLALPPYYAGIAQALALLRYGFDTVSLWHCFSNLVPEQHILSRVDQTWALITELGLRVGYAILIADDINNLVSFKTAVLSHYPTELRIRDGVPDPFLQVPTNPLRDQVNAKRMREFIAQTRGILTV